MLSKASRADLADSALHAPEASFGGVEFYETPAGQGRRAGVPACLESSPSRWEQARPWAALVMFLDLNGAHWDPDPPDTDEAEAAMLAITAHEVDEAWAANWLRARVTFP